MRQRVLMMHIAMMTTTNSLVRRSDSRIKWI